MKNSDNSGSFGMAVKGELCRGSLPDCCVMAELASAVFACAGLVLDSDGRHVCFATESMAFAKRLLGTITGALKLDAYISVCENTLKRKRSYTVTVPDGDLFLTLVGLDGKNMFSGAPADYITRRDCCKEAALKGAFLGCGSASDPKKSYRFEFVTKNEAYADFLAGVLEYFSIPSKKVSRKDRFVIYLNEGDAACALMSKIGAHGAVLNFENVRILKETRNNVNRAVNCETANISRMIAAAMSQVEAINTIRDKIGLDALPQKLKDACTLRLANQDASLSDLCRLTGATKSAMNHRFRKIGEIANSLKGVTKP